MPISAVCPSCKANYTLVDTQAGKTVRCAQCQGTFVVPQYLTEVSAPTNWQNDFDAPDPAPRQNTPRRAESEPSSHRTLWIILGSVTALIFVLGIATGLVIVFTPQTDSPIGEQVLNVPFVQGGQIQWNTPRHRRRNTAHHFYQVQLQAGTAYQFDLTSPTMDSYLVVEDERGNSMAEDDDGGDGMNSRIVFTPPATATYRITATTLTGEDPGGDYTLSGRTFP